MEFELDPRNLKHFLEDHPERGINQALLNAIANGEPKVFENEPRADRSGSHLIIGPDGNRRFWTIVALQISEDRWRPITGWPSTNLEIRRHQEN